MQANRTHPFDTLHRSFVYKFALEEKIPAKASFYQHHQAYNDLEMKRYALNPGIKRAVFDLNSLLVYI